MTTTILVIFSLVYLGMILGGLPFVQLNRTGVALLGAIAVIATDSLSVEEAARSVHLPTLLLLFSFMVVSAQLRLAGFYDRVALKLETLRATPPTLLAALIVVSGLLSAVFSNDIVCLAVAPVLVEVCQRRRLAPVPFLLALACAANIGSALTLIGNPQNMLIGQQLQMPFASYMAEAVLPVAVGLLLTWGLVVLSMRGRWQSANAGAFTPPASAAEPRRWQTVKGLVVALAILLAFLFTPWPREVIALTGAGVLLLSRRMHSSDMLGMLDWELLVLFMGLFVVNAALQHTGIPTRLVIDAARSGIQLDQPGPMFGAAFLLSNIVSNVPAVMLLLPMATHPLDGSLLALVSTFAGNLFIVGSIANIIVVDAARRRGLHIDWRQHAALGVPVTVSTLAVVGLYLHWRLS